MEVKASFQGTVVVMVIFVVIQSSKFLDDSYGAVGAQEQDLVWKQRYCQCAGD